MLPPTEPEWRFSLCRPVVPSLAASLRPRCFFCFFLFFFFGRASADVISASDSLSVSLELATDTHQWSRTRISDHRRRTRISDHGHASVITDTHQWSRTRISDHRHASVITDTHQWSRTCISDHGHTSVTTGNVHASVITTYTSYVCY